MNRRGVLGVVVLSIVLSGAAGASARPDEARYERYDFNKLMDSFHESLRSDIPGIVEATIYNLVEYKCYFPDREYSRLVRALNDVARGSSDSAIAFKANMAAMYLSYGSRLEDTSVFSPYDHAPAFKLVARQLEKKFLISRSSD